ncbi:MAG: Mur ligase domain-containing protein, partial [Candidatus Saccharimonadales bacterium]
MKIHCIGIGGIGVSALAQYYLSEGHEVSGFDLTASEITDFLRGKGVRITTGDDIGHVKEGMDLVVYSPAVPRDNPELKRARKLGIPVKSYPEALGELTKRYKTIAVAGSHGKSTTTAMIALILERAGLDPTVIVGTKLKEFGGSNFRKGKGEYLVIEACEYDGSFLEYQPYGAVVTNVDKEHLDYFKTFANVKKTFATFIKKIPEGGFLIYNGDDRNIAIPKKPMFLPQKFSLRQIAAKKLAKLLKVPGKHNVQNALAALEAARAIGGVSDSVSLKALAAYRGSWRRFEEKKGKAGKKS